MNPRKIAVICCTNDAVAFNECRTYVKALDLPDGFTLEIIPITGASGMAAGYNEALLRTDAKYKVYLHQDTLVVHRGFFTELISLFEQNIDIGLIGVSGAMSLPESGIWWETSERTGKVYHSLNGDMRLLDFGNHSIPWTEVGMVDGLLMATQADLPWRDDLFPGWHFYDVSQCEEFIRAGFKVIVPFQNSPWCLHDCGITHIGPDFLHDRDRYLDYYKDSRSNT
jgi:hypothetical protein